MAQKQFVKTNGIGFDFTDNPAEAMHFTSTPDAQRSRDRLAKQWKNLFFAVEQDPNGIILLAVYLARNT